MLKDTEHAPLNSLSTTQMTFGFSFYQFLFFLDESYAKSLFVLGVNQDRLRLLQQVGALKTKFVCISRTSQQVSLCCFFLKDLFGVWTSTIFLVLFIINNIVLYMQVDTNDRLHYLTETARFQTVAEEVKVYKGAINHIKWHLQVKYKKLWNLFRHFFGCLF